MILEDDHIVLAAEYVLGTLDPPEIAEAERLLAGEPAFARLVSEWERRFGELSAMVAAIEPPAGLLERIHTLLPEVVQASSIASSATDDVMQPDGRVRLGVAPQLEMPASPTQSGDATRGAPANSVTGDSVKDDRAAGGPDSSSAFTDDAGRALILSTDVRRWRAAGIAFGVLAALFAAAFVMAVVWPNLLPPQLRPKPRVIERTVEKVTEKPAERPGRFVAVLQRDSVSPAFILTVDLATRTMTVRRVAAETPAGKSYELWLVSSQFPAPRSLGIVGASEYTAPLTLANYPAETLSDASYAISLEPEGGSPSGQVTGPVLWSGKLIETVQPGTNP
jgi:anti-sigma-K factor RskA